MKEKRTTLVALAIGIVLLPLLTQAAQRPLSDFLSQQGTYCLNVDNTGNAVCPTTGINCVQQVPGYPNFADWTDPFNVESASFDYAGLINQALGGTLGTSVNGTINEIQQKDGSFKVTIVLITKNALAWAHSGIGVTLPGTAPLLFGHRPNEVAAGALPSLGDCTTKIVLTGPGPNMPLPDFFELAICGSPTWSLDSVSFSGSSNGTLPNGAPGRLQVTEVGLITVFVKQFFVLGVPSRVAFDAFPAEHIDITATGN